MAAQQVGHRVDRVDQRVEQGGQDRAAAIRLGLTRSRGPGQLPLGAPQVGEGPRWMLRPQCLLQAFHGRVDIPGDAGRRGHGDVGAGVMQVAGQRLDARCDPAPGRQDAGVERQVRPVPGWLAAGPLERCAHHGLRSPARSRQPGQARDVVGLGIDVHAHDRAEVLVQRLEPRGGRVLERPGLPGRPDEIGDDSQRAADQGVEGTVLDGAHRARLCGGDEQDHVGGQEDRVQRVVRHEN
jgi:hypothetical protein